MSRPQYVLFDYGVGNLHSLRKSLERVGCDAQLTQDTKELVGADVAVLPGVGAFGHVMRSLAGAEEGLRERHHDGRPILGVCIGKQILYEASEETPDVPGLGILAGTVKRLPRDAGKVPHMGWNDLAAADGPLAPLAGDHVYYVHSYAAEPGPATTATTTYGMTFSAAARDHNTWAYQFHPEKSSAVGHRILQDTVAAMEEVL